MLSRDKRLERAQMRVLFTVPFFAPGVAKLPVVWDEKIDTACTDGREIRWNPGFFDRMKDQELVTVLCHEVCHCMLGHLWRAPGGADWEAWNKATDYAVNLMLKEFSAGVMAKNLADPFPFPDPQDAYCANPAFSNMAEEVIYSLLQSNKPPGAGGNKPGGGQAKPQGAGSPSGSGGSNKTPPGGTGSVPGKPQPGSMPSFGQMSQPKASASSQLANDWDGTLIQACQMAQGRGELPAGMSRFVDALINPKVPWQEILRSWLREQCSDDWNFLEPAMEYSSSEFIMPSLKSEKMGPVVFATDTSGSINNELLRQFQGEKQACLDEMRPSSLLDIYCDSAIHKVAEYRVGDVIGKDAPGGGGTSFVPVWKHLETLPVRPKCLVYLTDLDGDFGRDPGVPIIWVTWTKGGKAPFGEVVYAG